MKLKLALSYSIDPMFERNSVLYWYLNNSYKKAHTSKFENITKNIN